MLVYRLLLNIDSPPQPPMSFLQELNAAVDAASAECAGHAASLETQWPALQDASAPRDPQALAAEVATAAAAAAGASSAQEGAIDALRAALRLQDDEYVRSLRLQVRARV